MFGHGHGQRHGCPTRRGFHGGLGGSGDFAGFGAQGGHGRHGGHGHGGFAGGGRGFWGRGGGGPMPGARRLSSAELQLVLLALLEQAPAHGYELIRALEERSQGFYTPSPGVIYPALTYLDELGQVEAAQEGNRKRYSLTDAGRAALDAQRGTATSILDALARIGERMEHVREAFAGVTDFDPGAHDERHQAQRALKEALISRRGCDAAEARRIAAILQRATAEILGRKP